MKKLLNSAILLFTLCVYSVAQVTPSLLITHISATQNVCCNGSIDGWATTTSSGGTPPYTYSWSPSGGTDSTSTCLIIGTYTVTVTDHSGNSATASATITQPTLLIATIGAHTNNTSCTSFNGSAMVSAAGGAFPYSYSWSPSGQTNATGTGLAAGTYTCTVSDNNCCSSTTSVTIAGTTGPMLTLSTTPDTNSCDGTASATVNGGATPYTYKWSPGGKTTATITGLCVGSYCCTVIDHNGCKDSTCTSVLSSRVVIHCACTGCSSSGPPTGITSVNKATTDVSIYPNPANDQLTISFQTPINGTLILYNTLGQKMIELTIPQSSISETLNVKTLPRGVYILSINTGRENIIKKVLKQ